MADDLSKGLGPFDMIADVNLDALSTDALNNLPVGVIRLDKAGIVKFCNISDGHLIELSPENAVGKNYFRDLAPFSKAPEIERRFLEDAESGSVNHNYVFQSGVVGQPIRANVQVRRAAEDGEYWMLSRVVQRFSGYQNYLEMGGSGLGNASQPRRASDICAAERIEVPGTIQGYGCLIIVDTEKDRILSCSENIQEYGAYGAADLIGSKATALLPPDLIEQALEVTGKSWLRFPASKRGSCVLSGRSEPFDCRITGKGPLLYVELYRDRGGKDFDWAALSQKLEGMRSATAQGQVFDLCAETAHFITGAERVLVYRFAPDWHGQVVGESLAGDSLPSFKGMHFPADDIPRQARALYRWTRSRFMPERDAPAVNLINATDMPSTGRDLSDVHVRTLSPMHVQYHRNIGVEGSFSLSLLADNRLWGLIIGHHPSPLPLSAQQKMALEMMADQLEHQLQLLTEERDHDRVMQEKFVLKSLIKASVKQRNISRALFDGSLTVLDLFDASGVAYVTGQHMTTLGNTPPEAIVRELLNMAFERREGWLYSHNCLVELMPGISHYREFASGALVAFLSEASRIALIWFRPEVPQVREWAGHPQLKLMVSEKDGRECVLPRISFERWTEIVEYVSEPFQPYTIALANELRSAVADMLVRRSQYLETLNRELITSRERLSAILDTVQEAVIAFDAAGMIVSFSHGAEQLFGVPANRMIGSMIGEILPKSSTGRIVGLPAALEAFGTVQNRVAKRLKVVRADKSDCDVESTLGEWHEGKTAFYVVVLRDVTQTAQLEEYANKSSKLEALGQIAGSIAHDFNNLLTIIAGNLELTEMAPDGPNVPARLRSASHAARRGAELTERLLGMVRSRTAGLASCAPDQVVLEAAALLHATVGDQIKLELDLQADGARVPVEAGQVENALINLLINSRDALEGKGKIRISTRLIDDIDGDGSPAGGPEQSAGDPKRPADPAKQSADPAKRPGGPGQVAADTVTTLRFLKLSVEDDGNGMPPEVIERATEPFFTTKAPGKGTGLGLAMVARLAEQGGGELKIASQIGSGTVIDLVLPEVDTAPVAAPKKAGLSRELGEGKTVLIVDDDVEVRSVVEGMTKLMGFDVRLASDADEALNILANHPPDLLLTDVVMPGAMTGYELAVAARDRYSISHIILMSGQEGRAVRDEKAFPLLRKPFTADALIGSISAQLHQIEEKRR